MLERLRRHPVPIVARFRHSLVLTFAFPDDLLRPLLPPGVVLDTFREYGFAAVALVQTERLRPYFIPAHLGQSFFLSGYRIFVRRAGGSSLRGLYILRSDTDRRSMALLGNLLTHYRYRLAKVTVAERAGQLEIEVRTPSAEADLHVLADLESRPAPLPAGSPFRTLEEARRFAGPLPYTFDYEASTGSLVVVRATRANWDPQPVAVDVRRATFFDREPFRDTEPVLANAFHVAGIDYRWERGDVVAAESDPS
jgi:Uncharacterized conserved protein (COG2071)